MIGHMSLVRWNNTVGIIVQSPDKYWHLATDTEPGADTEGRLYGFKHSWAFDQRPIAELARIFKFEEIDNQAIDAMNQTIQIWLELAENGEDADWKKEKYGGKFLHGCPLCQYVAEGGDTTMMDCGLRCPMVGHWGENLCDYNGATYNEWVHEDDPGQRKVKARAIVNEMIKVRAEMIANLTKEETVKQESYAEMKIKRVEVVEKTIENTLRLKLVKEGNATILLAVDEDGCEIGGGCIVVIKEDGTLSRCQYINKDLGLQLDASGRIIE